MLGGLWGRLCGLGIGGLASFLGLLSGLGHGLLIRALGLFYEFTFTIILNVNSQVSIINFNFVLYLIKY
jgi:hypothetical protein